MSIPILLIIALASPAAGQQPIVYRDLDGVEIPLAESTLALGGVGPASRKADHATVAVADNRDIAIAFHTNRENISGYPLLKQVEVAYFQFLGNDSWGHVSTEVVGSIGHNPLSAFLLQDLVKCERPDIVAVGDKFFVTWTRIYSMDYIGQLGTEQEFEPAVLECSWLELNPSNQVVVHNGGNPVGLGFELDAHVGGGGRKFEVRDCAGVPDAVVLKDASLQPNQVKVAVGYPHQSVFSTPLNNNRSFEMRLVTSVFDTATNSFLPPAKSDIQLAIPFNGPSSLSGSSAGLILPDLEPSFEDNAFWMTYEVQIMRIGPPNYPTGVIKLDYWQQPSGLGWALQASRSFKSTPSNPPIVRRRPDISTRPTTINDEIVTIVFNEIDPDPLALDPSKNVYLNQMQYISGGLSVPTGLIPAWPNTPLKDDGKPVAVHGRNLIGSPHAFADRTDIASSSCDIISDKLETYGTNPFSSVGRPAVSHHFEAGGIDPDYFAVVYEKVESSGDPERIWLTVD